VKILRCRRAPARKEAIEERRASFPDLPSCAVVLLFQTMLSCLTPIVRGIDPRRGCCVPFALSASVVSRSSRRGRNRHRYASPARPAVFALLAPARCAIWQSRIAQPTNMLAAFAPRRSARDRARSPEAHLAKLETLQRRSCRRLSSRFSVFTHCRVYYEVESRSGHRRASDSPRRLGEISRVPSALSRSKPFRMDCLDFCRMSSSGTKNGSPARPRGPPLISRVLERDSGRERNQGRSIIVMINGNVSTTIAPSRTLSARFYIRSDRC